MKVPGAEKDVLIEAWSINVAMMKKLVIEVLNSTRSFMEEDRAIIRIIPSRFLTGAMPIGWYIVKLIGSATLMDALQSPRFACPNCKRWLGHAYRVKLKNVCISIPNRNFNIVLKVHSAIPTCSGDPLGGGGSARLVTGIVVKIHSKFTCSFRGLPFTEKIIRETNSVAPLHHNRRKRKMRSSLPWTSVHTSHILSGWWKDWSLSSGRTANGSIALPCGLEGNDGAPPSPDWLPGSSRGRLAACCSSATIATALLWSVTRLAAIVSSPSCKEAPKTGSWTFSAIGSSAVTSPITLSSSSDNVALQISKCSLAILMAALAFSIASINSRSCRWKSAVYSCHRATAEARKSRQRTWFWERPSLAASKASRAFPSSATDLNIWSVVLWPSASAAPCRIAWTSGAYLSGCFLMAAVSLLSVWAAWLRWAEGDGGGIGGGKLWGVCSEGRQGGSGGSPFPVSVTTVVYSVGADWSSMAFPFNAAFPFCCGWPLEPSPWLPCPFPWRCFAPLGVRGLWFQDDSELPQFWFHWGFCFLWDWDRPGGVNPGTASSQLAPQCWQWYAVALAVLRHQPHCQGSPAIAAVTNFRWWGSLEWWDSRVCLSRRRLGLVSFTIPRLWRCQASRAFALFRLNDLLALGLMMTINEAQQPKPKSHRAWRGQSQKCWAGRANRPMVRAYTVQPGPKRRANRIVRQLSKQQWGKVNSGLLKATRAQRLRASWANSSGARWIVACSRPPEHRNCAPAEQTAVGRGE